MSADLFRHLRRVGDLSLADIERALESRASTRALLDRVSAIARPGEGTAKILMLFAKMASTPTEWLEGDVQVEMGGDESITVVEILLDHGGIIERAFPTWRVDVGVAEFVNAVTNLPHLVAPLVPTTIGANRVVLAATEAAERKITVPRMEIPAEFGVLVAGDEPPPKSTPEPVARSTPEEVAKPTTRKRRPVVVSQRKDPRREPDD